MYVCMYVCTYVCMYETAGGFGVVAAVRLQENFAIFTFI